MSGSPELAAVLRDQAPFLAVATIGSAVVLLVPGWGGSTATWALIGLLWLGGAVDAARRSAGTDRAWLTARVGLQNVIIQLVVALPAIGAGLLRLSRAPEARFGAAFLSNALTTLVVLPALSAVILTCAALVVAVPLHLLLSRSSRPAGLLLLAALVGLTGSGRAVATPFGAGQAERCGGSAELELDHVPVAVRDLEAAGRAFERLGFVLKPGRPHDNGLRNDHVKFPDGREIELITIDRPPIDELGRWYAARLAEGPGPVFLALHGGPVREVAARLESEAARMRVGRTILSFPPGHRWRHLFFGQLNASPTDLPEHFDHPNTARTLVEVWLAGDPTGELALLERFGAERCHGEEILPRVGEVRSIGLAGGRLLVLPEARRLHAGRPLVGLTVLVDRLRPVRERAAGLGLSATEGRGADGRPRIVIDLSESHGLWLGFVEEG